MSETTTETYKIQVPGGHVFAKKWIPQSVSSETPLILLHDSLGSVDQWRDFPARLAESLSRCVIAYDRLGFGQSAARGALPSKEFIEEEATRYFPNIKKYLSIREFVLLGHSVGGAMAIAVAARDPDCQAVVTVSAQAFVEDLTVRGILEAKHMFDQPGQLDRLAKWHGAKAEWVLDAWTNTWLSAEFADWSLGPALAQVRCPVLAIHGENDEYGSSAFPKFISDNAGGPAERLLLKNCGHVPHKEQPREVIGAVKEFIYSGSFNL